MDPACLGCARPLKPGAAFCAHCGLRAGEPPPPRPAPEPDESLRRQAHREWGEIRSVLLVYVALLGVQGLTALAVHLGMGEFPADVLGTSLFAVATLVAVALQGRDLGALHVRPGFGPLGYAGILAASWPIAALVALFVWATESLFRLKADRYLDTYEGRWAGWAVLLVCVAPAVLEELCFRGLIFGKLRRHLRLAEAFFISSVAFAILHLSVVSLVTHLPMGLYFCWLRHRSGSLHPAMLAHFLHNAWVLAGERYGVLPGGS
jgi:membrane protease YdiL (CAAX protease family)